MTLGTYTRYAIYYLPPLGSDLAGFGARWLGWDVDRGTALQSVAPELTQTPRKYGFHGTLKPPFRLLAGQTYAALETACAALARGLHPVHLDGLALSRMGRFFALTPEGETAALPALAAACVRDLDGFRAPPDPAELERRRAKGLSPAQEALLTQWGYPYVMAQFRFHLTLTGPVAKADQTAVEVLITEALPALPRPFVIEEIALVGERDDGAFETLRRLPLGASAQPT